jgi:hypothetical protein
MPFSVATCLAGSGTLGVILGFVVANAVNIFLLPPWFLATATASLMAYVSTLEGCEGDLVRCVSMKCVGLARLVTSACRETEVPSKVLALAGQVGTRLAAFDRQYHIKDRVLAGGMWVFEKVSGSKQPANRPRRKRPRRDEQVYGPTFDSNQYPPLPEQPRY